MLERGFADTVEEILAAAFNHCECVCLWVCVCLRAFLKGWQGMCPLHFESVKMGSLIFLSYSSLEVLVCV